MFGFEKWRDGLIEELNQGSEVMETAKGPMEYSKEGSSPFVLYGHGGPGGYDQGLLLAGKLKGAYGTLSVSRPGYLRTPLATGRTFEEQADAMAALLDAVGIDRVAVSGASAGGPPAIHFAARHPDRIVALLLTCAVTTVYPVHVPAWARAMVFSDRGSQLQTWLFDHFPRPMIKMMLTQSSTFKVRERELEAARIMSDPARYEFARGLQYSQAPGGRRRAGLENDLDQFELIDGPLPLSKIQCPTLICHGRRDGDVGYDHAETAHRLIPNSRLHTLENGGHVVWLSEGAEEMHRLQMQFLQEHLGQPAMGGAGSSG